MKTGRTVIVTGATGGMGAGFVHRFLANGDTVIATDTSDEELGKLAESASTGALHVTSADITDEEALTRIARLAKKVSGRVDVLVNVAGYFPIQPFMELTAKDWRRVVDVNLTGAALTCKAICPLMTGRGWGRIVNIGSASIYEGVASQAPYVAAKAGLVGLSRSLARELGGDGITVNVVAPGLTLTDKAKEILPKEIQKKAIESRCLKREERAGDLTGTVFFLASPEADFVTGQTIVVDGGNAML